MNSAAVSQMLFWFLISGVATPPNSAAPAAVTLVNASSPYTAGAGSGGDTFADTSATDRRQEESKPYDQTKPAIKAFPAYDRLEIVSPNQPLTLAAENEIPLRIHGSGLTTLEGTQIQYFGADGKTPDFVDGSLQIMPILHHPDGDSYVKILPMRLGKVELTLEGVFPDGGVARQKIIIEVGPAQKRPEQLIVGKLGIPKRNATKVLMALTGYGTRSALIVYAKYDTLDTVIRIDPPFATFRIRSTDQTDPIQLDRQTGWLAPIHPGQALVETSYGDRTNLTCVVVEQALNPDRSYFEKNCQQLLSRGEKLGPQE